MLRAATLSLVAASLRRSKRPFTRWQKLQPTSRRIRFHGRRTRVLIQFFPCLGTFKFQILSSTVQVAFFKHLYSCIFSISVALLHLGGMSTTPTAFGVYSCLLSRQNSYFGRFTQQFQTFERPSILEHPIPPSHPKPTLAVRETIVGNDRKLDVPLLLCRASVA